MHRIVGEATLMAPEQPQPEQEDLLNALKREIAAAWESDDVRHQKLTPLDEVRAGLVVFEQSLWQAVPAFAGSTLSFTT